MPNLQQIMAEQVGGEHYQRMKIQPVEFCYHNQIPCIEAEAITHIVRHKFKNGVEDINKAIHLLQILKKLEYGHDKHNDECAKP